MELHSQIYNYVKNNDGNVFDVPVSEEQLNTLFSDLINRVQEGSDFYYDAYANCLFDLYQQHQIAPPVLLIFDYAQTLFEVESRYPIDFISTSLIRVCLQMMKYDDLFGVEEWQSLYNEGPSQMKHIFACGIFAVSGFDEDLYVDCCRKIKYDCFFRLLELSGIIPDQISVEDLIAVNTTIPDDVRFKITTEVALGQKPKEIVYN